MRYASDGGIAALEQGIDRQRILTGATVDMHPKLIEAALMKLSGQTIKAIAVRFGVCTATASGWVKGGLRQRGLCGYEYK